MIRVVFFTAGENTTGFSITGHSGFEEAGKDIVCSAVSSAAYMAANTVIEVIGDKVEAEVEDGKMLISIPAPSESSLTVLKGLELHLKELASQYPEFITLKYGGVNNA